MKSKLLSAVLCILLAPLIVYAATTIYGGGNVTQIINPSASGEHVLKTGGATLGIQIGSVKWLWPTAQETANQVLKGDGSGNLVFASVASLGAAPDSATYITQTAHAALTAEQALNTLTANRLLRNTTGGVLADSLLSDDGTNVSVTGGAFLLINGTASVPSTGFASQTNFGWYRNAANIIALGRGGTNDFALVAGDVSIPAGNYYGWSSTTDAMGSVDSTISRESVGIIQLGLDASTPTNQTLKGPDGSGTNIVGGDMTIAPGRGTGTGAGGSLFFATAPPGTTGSAQNALVDRIQIESTGGLRWLTGTKPSCAAGIRGTTYYVAGGASVLDTFEVCRKDAADAYAWVTLF